jgi:hypothetical protein
MKTKMKLFIVCLTALTFTFAACHSQEKKSANTEQNSATANITYTCPMHPEVTSDKPGKCPKCGMDLVEKKVDNNTNSDTTKMK